MVSAMFVLPGPASTACLWSLQRFGAAKIQTLCTQAKVTHSWPFQAGSPAEEITVQRGIKGSFLLGNI